MGIISECNPLKIDDFKKIQKNPEKAVIWGLAGGIILGLSYCKKTKDYFLDSATTIHGISAAFVVNAFAINLIHQVICNCWKYSEEPQKTIPTIEKQLQEKKEAQSKAETDYEQSLLNVLKLKHNIKKEEKNCLNTYQEKGEKHRELCEECEALQKLLGEEKKIQINLNHRHEKDKKIKEDRDLLGENTKKKKSFFDEIGVLNRKKLEYGSKIKNVRDEINKLSETESNASKRKKMIESKLNELEVFFEEQDKKFERLELSKKESFLKLANYQEVTNKKKGEYEAFQKLDELGPLLKKTSGIKNLKQLVVNVEKEFLDKQKILADKIKKVEKATDEYLKAKIGYEQKVAFKEKKQEILGKNKYLIFEINERSEKLKKNKTNLAQQNSEFAKSSINPVTEFCKKKAADLFDVESHEQQKDKNQKFQKLIQEKIQNFETNEKTLQDSEGLSEEIKQYNLLIKNNLLLIDELNTKISNLENFNKENFDFLETKKTEDEEEYVLTNKKLVAIEIELDIKKGILAQEEKRIQTAKNLNELSIIHKKALLQEAEESGVYSHHVEAIEELETEKATKNEEKKIIESDLKKAREEEINATQAYTKIKESFDGALENEEGLEKRLRELKSELEKLDEEIIDTEKKLGQAEEDFTNLQRDGLILLSKRDYCLKSIPQHEFQKKISSASEAEKAIDRTNNLLKEKERQRDVLWESTEVEVFGNKINDAIVLFENSRELTSPKEIIKEKSLYNELSIKNKKSKYLRAYQDFYEVKTNLKEGALTDSIAKQEIDALFFYEIALMKEKELYELELSNYNEEFISDLISIEKKELELKILQLRRKRHQEYINLKIIKTPIIRSTFLQNRAADSEKFLIPKPPSVEHVQKFRGKMKEFLKEEFELRLKLNEKKGDFDISEIFLILEMACELAILDHQIFLEETKKPKELLNERVGETMALAEKFRNENKLPERGEQHKGNLSKIKQDIQADQNFIVNPNESLMITLRKLFNTDEFRTLGEILYLKLNLIRIYENKGSKKYVFNKITIKKELNNSYLNHLKQEYAKLQVNNENQLHQSQTEEKNWVLLIIKIATYAIPHLILFGGYRYLTGKIAYSSKIGNISWNAAFTICCVSSAVLLGCNQKIK